MSSAIPTKCLYFGFGLREEMTIVSESRHLIELEDRFLCFRLPTPAEVATLRATPKPVMVVVDDDYLAIMTDYRMPLVYRAKMLKQYLPSWRYLQGRASCFLLANDQLQRGLRAPTYRIDPYWRIGERSSPHPKKTSDPLRVGFLGTRSHLADLYSILPTLLEVLRARPTIQLTLFLGKYCPPALAALPNVTNHLPMAWIDYHDLLSQLSLDISLLPTLKTAVNSARSYNKLYEAIFAGGVCWFTLPYPHHDYGVSNQLGGSFTSANLLPLLDHALAAPESLASQRAIAHMQALTLQREILQQQQYLYQSPLKSLI